MSTPYLGQLMLIAFNFAPKGYALCNGQLLSINQNAALFSLLGTTYGGDGIRNFALPNLQSRVAISAGAGFVLGQLSGSESVTLTTAQMPIHTHTLTVSNSTTTTSKTPSGSTVGAGANSSSPYSTAATGVMASTALSLTGGGAAHENRSPYLVLNWVIALVGIFPSQS